MTTMRENPIGWVALFLVCLFPLLVLAIWPEESLRFILSDSPLNGWLGSLYGGYLVAGFLGVVGIPARAFREWEGSIDWDSFERTRIFRVLKFVEDRVVWLLPMVFVVVALILVIF